MTDPGEDEKAVIVDLDKASRRMEDRARQSDRDIGLDLANLRAATDDETLYLGDIAVIDAMLRFFVAGLAAALEPLQRGEDIDLTEAVNRLAAPPVAALLGRDPRFTPVPGWNMAREGGIADFAARVYGMPDGAGSDERLRIAFWLLADQVMSAVTQANAGKDWRHMVDAAIEELTKTLIGIDPRGI